MFTNIEMDQVFPGAIDSLSVCLPHLPRVMFVTG